MAKLICQKAVKQLVKELDRVPTAEYLTALDEDLRERICRQCMIKSQGVRMKRDAFVGVPARPLRG